MKILFLGPGNPPSCLNHNGDNLVSVNCPIDMDFIKRLDVDFIISYNYPHIITADIVKEYHTHAINLHISYLPWNRGADPNFWSFMDNTPKGVTIHYIDEGIDTGDIIAQKLVRLSAKDTLRTNYEKLHKAMLDLFEKTWPSISSGHYLKRKKQKGKGSYHNGRDINKYMAAMPKGWNTQCWDLMQ